MKNLLNFAIRKQLIHTMNHKSILMPHACQKIGWGLLSLSLVIFTVKALFVQDIHVAWYLAKTIHVITLLAFFFICMSKEKEEDEMIITYRMKATGITGYVFFVILMILSIILELKPTFLFSKAESTLSAFLSEFFLIILPVLLFIVYFITFKGLIVKSKMQ